MTDVDCGMPNSSAIAKAHTWIDGLVEDRAASFAEIAKREGKVERHIRLLAPLAFVSPVAISNISDGIFPPIGVPELARRVTYSWSKHHS
jgi:site-specific DNA recombinase